MLTYRQAVIGDLKSLCRFTDWWLAGRGKARGAAGAINDYFISPGQHSKYINKYKTWVCCNGKTIVAWAVVENSGTMIHLLVAGEYRRKGIGTAFLTILIPSFIRSKIDQTSGDPRGFYEKLGYRKVKRLRSRSRFDIDKVRPKRKPNIDLMELVN